MLPRIQRTLAELEMLQRIDLSERPRLHYEEMFPSSRRAYTAEDWNNNDLIINELREKREELFHERIVHQYLKLTNTLPLPDPQFKSHLYQPGHDSFNPCRLNVEHLQDLGNKCTAISFRGDRIFDVEPMFNFFLEHSVQQYPHRNVNMGIFQFRLWI